MSKSKSKASKNPTPQPLDPKVGSIRASLMPEMHKLLKLAFDTQNDELLGNLILHATEVNDLYDLALALIRTGKGNLVIEKFKALSPDIMNQLKNYTGTKGTLLHVATMLKNPELVQWLVGKAFDVNACNTDNQTPLHIAIECQDHESLRFLWDNGAKEIHNSKESHPAKLIKPLDLAVKVCDRVAIKILGGKIAMAKGALRPPAPLPQNKPCPTPTESQKVYCEYLSAIFNKNTLRHAAKFVEMSKQFLDKYDESVALASPPSAAGGNPQDIVGQYSSIVIGLTTIIPFYNFLSDDSLVKCIIKVGERTQDSTSLVDLYAALCQYNLYNNDTIATYYAQKALDITQLQPCPQKLCIAYLNLAISYSNYDDKQATIYFDLAHKTNPQDQETLRWQCIMAMKYKNWGVALKIASTMESSEVLILEILLKSNALLPRDALERALKLNIQTDSILYEHYMNVICSANIKLGNYDYVIKLLDKSINIASDTRAIGSITGILQAFVACGRAGDGLKYLADLHLKFPSLVKSSFPPLKYASFLLYENSQHYREATIILDAINGLQGKTRDISIVLDLANRTRFYTEMQRGNFDAAEVCLKRTSLNQITHKNLLESLKLKAHEASAAAVAAAAPSPEDVSDDALNNATIESILGNDPSQPDLGAPSVAAAASVDEEITIESIDPKKIHAYFQQQKALLAKTKFTDMPTHDKHNTSWTIPGGAKYNSQQKGVYKLKGREHFYVNMNELSIDRHHMESFLNAIEAKGLVSKQQGAIGVKFFKGFVEVKVNADIRVWGTKVYVNDEGEYLIIIGGYGNHAAAARAARSSLKVEKVSIDKDFHPQCPSDAGAAAFSLDTEFDIFDPDLRSQEFVGLVGSAT